MKIYFEKHQEVEVDLQLEGVTTKTENLSRIFGVEVDLQLEVTVFHRGIRRV